jgi:hypothetical protein
VLDYSEARLGAKLVLISIANHAKRDGTGAWPSVATIAREAGLSDRQVQNLLPDLEKLGELRIDREAGPYGTHLYSLAKMDAKSSPVQGFHRCKIEQKGVRNPGENHAEISPKPKSFNQKQTINTPSASSTSNNQPQKVTRMIADKRDFWRQVLEVLKNDGVDPQHFNTYFRQTSLRDVRADIYIVVVPTWQHKDLLEEKYKTKFLAAIRRRGEEPRGVEFVVES